MLLKGKGISEGIALGRAYIYSPFTIDVAPAYFEGEPAKALTAAEIARMKSEKELEALIERVKKVDEKKADIFGAHLAILLDLQIEDEIKAKIIEDKMEPAYAIQVIFEKYIQTLGSTDNISMKERISDLKDVKLRFLRNFYGGKEQSISYLPSPVIIVCHDLLPSDTITMDRNNVLGIVTEIGSQTSHSAIIAKSFGIPAILGITNLMEKAKNNQEIIIDAGKNTIILSPTEEQINIYSKKRAISMLEKEANKKYLTTNTKTKDNTKIYLGLNIGSNYLYELHNFKYVDFIGLFRSEFLYMNRDSLPTEEEQFKQYKKVLASAKNKKVTIRTLDIGGDKNLSYLNLPNEANPFLGVRAIRFCLANETIFITQLKALYRASIYGNLDILLPMIESIEEIRKVKVLIEQVKKELKSENKSFSPSVRLGIMIEVPSIAIMSREVVKEVDFASIGTNDLCQYLLACDRSNPKMDSYYQTFNPALFRLMYYVAQSFNAAGKDLSVCGELAGDPKAAILLVGSGIKNLSMNISNIINVRMTLEKYTLEELKEISHKAINLSTEEEVKNYLQTIRK